MMYIGDVWEGSLGCLWEGFGKDPVVIVIVLSNLIVTHSVAALFRHRQEKRLIQTERQELIRCKQTEFATLK